VLEEVGLATCVWASPHHAERGEAQRMKLAAHLVPAARRADFSSATVEEKEERKKARAGKGALYIFDEPTTACT